MKRIALFSICLLLGGCCLFSDSRSTVTINVEKASKNSIKMLCIHFGPEKYCPIEVTLKPGESSSAMFCPDSPGSHLDFNFDIGHQRYEWASWESKLFGKTFAIGFFRKHNRYQIIIDLKADYTFFIKVYQRNGLFSKKLIVQGYDKMTSMPLEYSGE